MGNFAANQIYRIMYSSEDLERFYFQYQTEVLPSGESLQSFCAKNKVPYNIFPKWFKDTRKKVVEVQVDGAPEITHEEKTKIGNQPNHVIMDAMRRAQLFFFTSVSEDTSTVVLEAISNRLPVLCFNACGMASVIDEKVGHKIKLTNPRQSVTDFAEALNRFEKNRDLLKAYSRNCKERQEELSWDNKAKRMVELYQQTLYQTGLLE